MRDQEHIQGAPAISELKRAAQPETRFYLNALADALLEKKRVRRVIALSAVVGLTAFSGASVREGAQADTPPLKLTPSLEYAGFSTNSLWATDRAEAISAGKEITDHHGNTVRVVLPLSQTQSEIKNDYDRICNFGESVAENGLIPEISMEGIQYKKESGRLTPGLGYLPSTYTEFRHTLKTVADELYTIEKDPNCNGSSTGAKPPQKVLVSYFNEPNNPTFVTDQTTAPEKLAAGENYFYKNIHKIAEDIGIDVEVVGGEFSFSHDPIGFMMRMKKFLTSQGITTPIADLVGFHAYPKDNTENTADVMRRVYVPLTRTAKDTFGDNIKIVYDEFGNHTKVPSGATPQYTKIIRPAGGLVGIDQQTQYVNDALNEAGAEAGVVGALNFQLNDDGNSGQTGLEFPNGQPKSLPGLNEISTTLDNLIAAAN